MRKLRDGWTRRWNLWCGWSLAWQRTLLLFFHDRLLFEEVFIIGIWMYTLNVLLQTAEIQVRVVTIGYSAFILLPLRIMNLYMLFQIALASKLFGAVITFEGFITLVDLLVTDQVGHLSERFIAALMVALVRALAIVHSGVLLQ